MTNYKPVPTDALKHMAEHSSMALGDWVRIRADLEHRLERATHMVKYWGESFDEQTTELETRSDYSSSPSL